MANDAAMMASSNPAHVMNLCEILSDAVWFWMLQAGLVLFAAFALFQNWKRRRRSEPAATRGAESMQYLLVICGLIIGIPIAICASVDVRLVNGHRVLWILFDGAVVGCVCLCNAWFRNDILLPFISWLRELEKNR
jgi:hypothetical protein